MFYFVYNFVLHYLSMPQTTSAHGTLELYQIFPLNACQSHKTHFMQALINTNNDHFLSLSSFYNNMLHELQMCQVPVGGGVGWGWWWCGRRGGRRFQQKYNKSVPKSPVFRFAEPRTCVSHTTTQTCVSHTTTHFWTNEGVVRYIAHAIS